MTPLTPDPKSFLLLTAHPKRAGSLCYAAADALRANAEAKGYTVTHFEAFDFPLVGDIATDGFPPEFDPVAQAISQADTIALCCPMWNYSVPGAFKNLLDGSIQAKKHFRFKSLTLPLLGKLGVPVGFLRTRRVITVWTADGPRYFYRLLWWQQLLTKQIFGLFTFAGVSWRAFLTYALGNVRQSTLPERETWLSRLRQLDF